MPITKTVPEQKLTFERLEGEGFKAFAAFKVYRDMGEDRSYSGTAELVGKSLSMITAWGSKFSWVARVDLFDQAEDHRRLLAIRKQSEKRRAIHATIGSELVQMARERFLTMTPEEKAKMNPTDVARWLSVGTEIEREALGMAKQIQIGGIGGGAIMPTGVVVEIIHSNKAPEIKGK